MTSSTGSNSTESQSKESKSKVANPVEFLALGLVALVVVLVGWNVVGDDALGRQVVLWVANVMMLATIWVGLRLRGQTWEHLGLRWRPVDRRGVARMVLQSLGVFLLALVGFMVGSMVMINLSGSELAGGDMSGYRYLQGNLPMLLLALAGVYVVSSFGEEVIYRGFLMTRIAEMGGGSKTAWSVAVIVSAVVFGLIHFGWGLFGIVQTAFMGLALAISFLLVKRNLWVLVLAHAYLDTILLVQLYLTPPAAG